MIEAGDSPLMYLLISTVVTLIVEWLRGLIKGIDGRIVNIVAWAVGVGATWLPVAIFAETTEIESRLGAGLVLAGLSSGWAEAKGALNNSRKLNAQKLETAGQGDEVFGGTNAADGGEVAGIPTAPSIDPNTSEKRFDPGYNPGDTGYDEKTGTFNPEK